MAERWSMNKKTLVSTSNRFNTWKKTHQFLGKVWIIIQSLPELLQHLSKSLEPWLRLQFIKHWGVTEDSIMEASHAVHIQVVLTSRDGGQVNKNFQLIDVYVARVKNGHEFKFKLKLSKFLFSLDG